jgi:hypothetical protein
MIVCPPIAICLLLCHEYDPCYLGVHAAAHFGCFYRMQEWVLLMRVAIQEFQIERLKETVPDSLEVFDELTCKPSISIWRVST